MDGERVWVTGTMLRDLVVCERRAWHDVHTSSELRDRTGSFVQLLWSEGVRHEAEILGRLDGRVVDLRAHPARGRVRQTIAALVDPTVDHVLGGEIVHADLLGRPDMISRIDGRWVVGDVKSGSPFMPDGVRIRHEYGVQVGLYARILDALHLGDGDRAFVIGPDGARVMFDLSAPWGDTTMSAVVQFLVRRARAILKAEEDTRGAASASCGMCHWRTVCRRELEAADDLTLLAEVGRSLRSALEVAVPTRAVLATLDLNAVARPKGRTTLPGVGAGRLARLRDRARLQLTTGATGYARVPLGLARAPLEWHFDIEADPTSGGAGGFVYLHGVWERRLRADGSDGNAFHHFFADGPDGERAAFAGAWALLTSDPTAMVYFYSSYERTMYRVLQRRYPDVCTADQVEAFFASPRVIDLYTAVVRPHTEWPLGSYGLKPIAKHLGFSWTAEDASGASSIAWYVEWLETGDPALREKIIDYNRSDCMAQPVVLDALIALPLGPPAWPPTGNGDVALLASPPSSSDGRSLAVGKEANACDVVRHEASSGRLQEMFELHERLTSPATPAVPSAPAIYDLPSLRVCAASGTGWGADDRTAPYRRLLDAMPLVGATAFAPAGDGGFALSERLRQVAPWLEPAISAIERSLRVGAWSGRPWLSWRPMLLVGGPGTGKSHFARSVSAAAAVRMSATDLGAATDALNFAGVSSGWSNALPCWPAREIAQHGIANPILVGDELDKAGGRRGSGGRVHDAILNMVEASTARAYADRCLLADLDLSAVCWIFTANDAGDIPAPLLSRLQVVEVEGPGPEHFDLLREAIEADIARDWAVPASAMPTLPIAAVDTLRRLFERRRSARALRAAIERLVQTAIPSRPEVLH